MIRSLAARGSGRWGHLLAAVAVLLLAGLNTLVLPGRAAARSGGGVVLPPWATPYGYSRADMTRLLAQFTTSGNDLAYYPTTPFQILSTDSALVEVRQVTRHDVPCAVLSPDCGLLFTQGGPYANAFHVGRAKSLFVPVDNADDSPPVVGVFPTSDMAAKAYIFGPHPLAGRDFAVCVDQRCRPLGPQYVAGPVETPPLLDGGGTHMITIGAFLSPMAPGHHDVRITGGYFGTDIFTTYGIGFLALDFTYRVHVDP